MLNSYIWLDNLLIKINHKKVRQSIKTSTSLIEAIRMGTLTNESQEHFFCTIRNLRLNKLKYVLLPLKTLNLKNPNKVQQPKRNHKNIYNPTLPIIFVTPRLPSQANCNEKMLPGNIYPSKKLQNPKTLKNVRNQPSSSLCFQRYFEN